jgi:hypothetical protein
MSGVGCNIPLHSFAFNSQPMGMRRQVPALQIKIDSIYCVHSNSTFPEVKTVSFVTICTDCNGYNNCKYTVGQIVADTTLHCRLIFLYP